MTAADLLARLQVLNNGLDIGVNGDDEQRALFALDMAQDYYETVAAVQGGIVNGSATLSTTGMQGYTTWPAGLLRVNSLHYADGTGEVDWLDEVGGHLDAPRPWPLLVTVSASPGKPGQAWGIPDDRIYWAPAPDASYNLIAFGFVAKTDLTTRAVTFGHNNLVALPLVAFANRLLKAGIDDPTEEMSALANETFLPVIRALRRRVRARPTGRAYTKVHRT